MASASLEILSSPLDSDLLRSRNWAELVGQVGDLQPIVNRLLGALASSQEGRLTIGRRIPSCPTVAHSPAASGGQSRVSTLFRARACRIEVRCSNLNRAMVRCVPFALPVLQ